MCSMVHRMTCTRLAGGTAASYCDDRKLLSVADALYSFSLPPSDDGQEQRRGDCGRQVPPVIHKIGYNRQQGSRDTPVHADENAH